jgi:hypothetical protein
MTTWNPRGLVRSPLPEDQVKRRIRFSEQHPEIHIRYDEVQRVWRGFIPLGENEAREIVEYELRALLDRLEHTLEGAENK